MGRNVSIEKQSRLIVGHESELAVYGIARATIAVHPYYD
jgi:hypothetical protein